MNHDDAPRSQCGVAGISTAQTSKITDVHHQRLAMIYVRQSTSHQVMEHRESTERQYALAQRAAALGWAGNRIVVIDDDLGCSGRTTQGRVGFKRLTDELAMNHVGIIFSLELSRLARSSRDWHALSELCGLHQSLLADEDGIYDANDINDRLLLGLKGIMTEVELHVMRSRLEYGRRNKAQRGELFHSVPRGYIRLPGGGVDLDPHEQVRSVISLVFDKFVELASAEAVWHYLVKHGIELPTRNTKMGILEWRRSTRSAVLGLLRHPMYAGAYVYGHQKPPADRSWSPEDEWQVLIKDQLPRYLTWDQYVRNRRTLQNNCTRGDTPGVCRCGPNLLAGLLYCACCQRRMSVQYRSSNGAYYQCTRHPLDSGRRRCPALTAPAIDTLIEQQVLKAIEPASVALSLQVLGDVEQERQRLIQQFKYRLEQARYESDHAQRQYMAVDPDNRLVAQSLEQRWEQSLERQREIEEERSRFLNSQPLTLSMQQQKQIESLCCDLPALWHNPQTSMQERQQIVRGVIQRVEATVYHDRQIVDVTIHWAGQFVSQHQVVRSVAQYDQMENFQALSQRIIELRRKGQRSPQIAKTLNEEGYRSPKRRCRFTGEMVRGLTSRNDIHQRIEICHLPDNQWRTKALARKLNIREKKLKDWATWGWVHIIQRPFGGTWIVWADDDEVSRLTELAARCRQGVIYPARLRTPKSLE